VWLLRRSLPIEVYRLFVVTHTSKMGSNELIRRIKMTKETINDLHLQHRRFQKLEAASANPFLDQKSLFSHTNKPKVNLGNKSDCTAHFIFKLTPYHF